jgi:hypothetical protein
MAITLWYESVSSLWLWPDTTVSSWKSTCSEAAYTCRVDVVGFEVDGTRYGLELQHARIFSRKLREFARGEYAGDLAEIKRRTRLDAAEWLDGAVPLADRVDRWTAEDRDDAIPLGDDVQARAAYAVLSITYSDGWDDREVFELWIALGTFLGLGAPTAGELPPAIMGGSTGKQSQEWRGAWHSVVRALHRPRGR